MIQGLSSYERFYSENGIDDKRLFHQSLRKNLLNHYDLDGSLRPKVAPNRFENCLSEQKFRRRGLCVDQPDNLSIVGKEHMVCKL